MTSTKGDLVVLTPIKQHPDHNIVKIHREETAKSDKVLLIGGGPHAGLIINKFDEKAVYDDISESSADVSLSFSVSLNDKHQRQVQEKRSLYFKLRKNVDLDVGRSVVHKFFRSLLSNLPADYVSFMKRAMTLLHKEFDEIASIIIDYKIVDEDEQVAIPDATQYDSGSELEEVTVGHVQEVLEHAFPNGLPTSTIAECLRCSEDETLAFLAELEASGTVRHVGDEWIRVDTKRVDESVEAHRHASASTSSSANDQPTVAIISCLFVEKQAIDALIEGSSTIHKYKSGGDSNVYTLGTIGAHRVVATKLALIGDSREAITSAGSITTRLLGNFQNIEHVFIVGVGGAVPHFTDASLHARLGDVIVSASRPHQYVYAHDLIIDRQTEQITGFAVRNWDADEKTIEKIVENGGETLLHEWNTATHDAVDSLTSSSGSSDVEWKAPHESTDVLAMPVSKGNVVVMPHPNADRKGAEIHLGTVGAMSTMKKYESIGGEEESLTQIRESFAESFGVRCMDAGFDSVVGAVVGSCVKSWALVRGISDYHYGQSRAGKVWQAHAAVRAAGLTRCIIQRLPKP
uniref:Winged helix-turn-helix domain-containing protein n=1 Tax=Caenorhabditis japonica TaxID=281687 RepID=A0A8R1HWB7_CAEJA